MKAAVAFALAGSALANYGYDSPSSVVADPVQSSAPAEMGYGGGYAAPSSEAASPVASSMAGDYGSWPKSSPASAVASAKPTWGSGDEDCDDEEGSWSKTSASPVMSSAKPTWGDEWTSTTWKQAVTTPVVKTTSWVDSWGHTQYGETTVTVTSTRTLTKTITKSKPAGAWPTPAYFDHMACCKTVVTVTVTETPGASYVKPTWATSAAPVVSSESAWSGNWEWTSKPVVSSAAPAASWSKPAYGGEGSWPAASSAAPAASWSKPAYGGEGSWPAASSAAPAAPSASMSASSSNGPIVTNGDKWGMTYTPYTSTGNCKTADEVDADLAKIKSYGFTTVRLYATDCNGLQNVGGSAKNHGLKIIVGVFIDKTGLEASWAQVDEIAAWGSAGNWDNVVMVVVGNEAIFNGYCSGSELAAYISKVKSYLQGKGCSGWVTTTEPTNIVEQNTCLCEVIDVAAANIQPFFTSSVSSSTAGDFVLSQLKQVEAACPGKTAYNLECGWPSSGSANGAAVPSQSDQKTAILDIIAKAGTKTCVFSFENDLWKGAGEFGVEASWGCSSVFSGSY